MLFMKKKKKMQKMLDLRVWKQKISPKDTNKV